MVKAKFYGGGDASLHMTLTGHAGAGAKGEDLVCAAVSALAQTLDQAVQRLYYQRMLCRCPRIELQEGSAEIIAVPKAQYRSEVAMVFWTVQNGISELAKSFPENVKLEEALRF